VALFFSSFLFILHPPHFLVNVEGSCPLGWEKEGDRCYFFSKEKKSWDEANKTCIERHKGHLASVSSEQVHKYLQGKETLGWIGGFKEDNQWVWSDSSEWDFNLGWGKGEPSKGQEKCVEYLWNSEHVWNNGDCSNKRKYVCSKRVSPGSDNSVQMDKEGCQSGECVELNCSPGWKGYWEEMNGQCYYWSQEKLFWGSAEEKCRSLGGHLASVTSQDIHDYIQQNEKNPDFVWLGATDQDKEGAWKWTDCNPWNFIKWGAGEPNNQKNEDADGEDCAILASNKTNGYKNWLDTQCRWTERQFVCSISKCAETGDSTDYTSVARAISSAVGLLFLALLVFFIYRHLRRTRAASTVEHNDENPRAFYCTKMCEKSKSTTFSYYVLLC